MSHVSSRPSRARGLKPRGLLRNSPPPDVAPFTGAWIETGAMLEEHCVRENVAPFTGAWIETINGRPPYGDGLRRALHGRVD